jgi:hypothetical protein
VAGCRCSKCEWYDLIKYPSGGKSVLRGNSVQRFKLHTRKEDDRSLSKILCAPAFSWKNAANKICATKELWILKFRSRGIAAVRAIIIRVSHVTRTLSARKGDEGGATCAAHPTLFSGQKVYILVENLYSKIILYMSSNGSWHPRAQERRYGKHLSRNQERREAPPLFSGSMGRTGTISITQVL